MALFSCCSGAPTTDSLDDVSSLPPANAGDGEERVERAVHQREPFCQSCRNGCGKVAACCCAPIKCCGTGLQTLASNCCNVFSSNLTHYWEGIGECMDHPWTCSNPRDEYPQDLEDLCCGLFACDKFQCWTDCCGLCLHLPAQACIVPVRLGGSVLTCCAALACASRPTLGRCIEFEWKVSDPLHCCEPEEEKYHHMGESIKLYPQGDFCAGYLKNVGFTTCRICCVPAKVCWDVSCTTFACTTCFTGCAPGPTYNACGRSGISCCEELAGCGIVKGAAERA